VQLGSLQIFHSSTRSIVCRKRWSVGTRSGAKIRILVAALAILIALATPRLSAAEPQWEGSSSSTQLRAMLWLQPDTDEVLDRIRGQTSDLPVQLLLDVLDPMPPELGAQLRIAYTLSQQQNVAVVIWFVRQTDAERHFFVNIALPKSQRLLTRDLGPSDTGSGAGGLSSVVKESAALVVRAALQAVQSGMSIGEVQAARFDNVTEPPRASAPSQPSAPEPAAIAGANSGGWRDTTNSPPELGFSPAASSEHNWKWAIGGEWLGVYDGPKGSTVAECASLRVERRLQWVKAFMSGGVCLNRQFDNTYGAFKIGRQEAALGANVILWRTGFEASLGAQFGAVFYERETLQTRPEVFAIGSPATHIMGKMGPEFRLLVPERGSRLQAGLVLGVDFLTNSLKIGYQVYPGVPGLSSPAFDQAVRVGVVQPYLALGLAVRF